METAWSMMAHAGLPGCYWAEVVATAVYLRNCLPTTAFNKKITSYEYWYRRKPILIISRCLVAWLMHIFQMLSGRSWTKSLKNYGLWVIVPSRKDTDYLMRRLKMLLYVKTSSSIKEILVMRLMKYNSKHLWSLIATLKEM